MIINEQEAHSRAMYWELSRRAPPGVPVYQQTPTQDDVWEALDGDKDDFLVYDRCGHLTFHIVLPYSFLHYPYVEAAIRATYQKNICNCSVSHTRKRTKRELENPQHIHHHHHTHHQQRESHHHRHSDHNTSQSQHEEDKNPEAPSIGHDHGPQHHQHHH
uniref:Selenoprotein P N-terminal domain-containing protein n=1 Tax=Echeneis naucrates TaxID=173247 RepID=A0A665WT99_ECHNA